MADSTNQWQVETQTIDPQKSALQAPRLNIHSIQQIETAGEEEARVFQEEAEVVSRSSVLPRQTDAPDIANRFDGGEGSLAEHVKRLEGGLQACRSDMQQLVAELEVLKQAVQDEMG